MTRAQSMNTIQYSCLRHFHPHHMSPTLHVVLTSARENERSLIISSNPHRDACGQAFRAAPLGFQRNPRRLDRGPRRFSPGVVCFLPLTLHITYFTRTPLSCSSGCCCFADKTIEQKKVFAQLIASSMDRLSDPPSESAAANFQILGLNIYPSFV